MFKVTHLKLFICGGSFILFFFFVVICQVNLSERPNEDADKEDCGVTCAGAR